MTDSSIVVQVHRGPLTESIHRGHIVVVDQFARTLASLGDPNTFIFVRSCAKPLQAISVVESGAITTFKFGPEQVSLMCSSHNGEFSHVVVVANMLQKLGLSKNSLSCPAQHPLYRPEADRLCELGIPLTQLHHNCSGKHAGMLALALQLETSTEGYTSSEHPVQRAMVNTILEMTGMHSNELVLGIDGCGVPVYGMSLAQLAYAFATLGKPERLSSRRSDACNQVIGAIREHPHYLAGTARFDTTLIRVTNGRIIGKMGAEGVFAMTIPDYGLGIAIKIEDGSERALYPAAIETLAQIGLLSEDELQQLDSFHKPPIVSGQGEIVGRMEPICKLRFTNT